MHVHRKNTIYGPTARTHNKIKGENFFNLIIIQYFPVNTMLFSCKQIEIAMYEQLETSSVTGTFL